KAEERAALDKQAPLHTFVPSRIKAVKDQTQLRAQKRQSGYADVRIPFIRVQRKITGDAADRFLEDSRILQVLARQQIPLGILHDDAIGCVHNHPAAVQLDLGDHVLRGTVRGKQQEPPRLQARTAGKIQESV